MPNVIRKHFIVLAMTSCCAVHLAACNEIGSESNPVETCGHNFKDAVINFNYAMDESNGDHLQKIILRNVTINNRPIVDTNITLMEARNAVVENGAIVCTLPCGFGTEEGVYRAYVEAPGYKTQYLQADASYRVFVQGCPSYNDNGLHLGVELERS